MNAWDKINHAVEELHQKEMNGVIDTEWMKVFDLLTTLESKLNIFEKVSLIGPQSLVIVEEIFMGHKDSSDILEFVAPEYLRIEENGNVFIKKDYCVIASKMQNGWICISFEDGKSQHDIAFDDIKDYDKYFQIFE